MEPTRHGAATCYPTRQVGGGEDQHYFGRGRERWKSCVGMLVHSPRPASAGRGAAEGRVLEEAPPEGTPASTDRWLCIEKELGEP